MKKLIYVLVFFCISCGVDTKKEVVNTTETKEKGIEKQLVDLVSLEGNIRGDIPVRINYLLDKDLAIGEIVYTNTAAKQPISLVGKIEDGVNLKLSEFDTLGNITGILTGTIKGDSIIGNWFSPKTRDGFDMNLAIINKEKVADSRRPKRKDIFGHYRYQFGIKGYEGMFDIAKVDDKKVAFALTAVTEYPGRNLANIERDTVILEGSSFTYVIPDTEDCGVKFSFYNDFVEVTYTNGYCNNVFGHNATVDGVFYKVK